MESLKKRSLSSIDNFLGRTLSKKTCEFMQLLLCLSTERLFSNPNELLLHAFYSVFSSCELKKHKTEIISSIKQCIQNNKELFEGLSLHENLSEIMPEKMTNVPIQQCVITTAQLLLQQKMPVLIIGDKVAQEVYKEIIARYKESNETSQVSSFNLNCLSTADIVIQNLEKHLQKRGKNELVPRGCKEILVAISDLYFPITDSDSKVQSLVKDLTATHSLVLNIFQLLLIVFQLILTLTNCLLA